MSDSTFVILDIIRANQPLPCIQAAQHISCIFTSPPCDVETDLLLKICPESCMAFDKLMASSTCTSFNEALVNNFIGIFLAFRNDYLQFNCRNISTYSDSGENGFDNDCTNLFSANVQGQLNSVGI